MKAQRVSSKTMISILKLAIFTSLIPACGGGPSDSYEASKIRPPVTSDPMAAVDQRSWESEAIVNNSTDVTINNSTLVTKVERETFLQDITEQTPTYTDEQIANDAEEQFEKREGKDKKEKDEKQLIATEDQVPPKKESPPMVEELPAKPAIPEKKAKPEIEKPIVTKPDVNTPQKPEPRAEKIPEPKVSPSPRDLCDDIDVTSAKKEVDLSFLYNKDTELTSSMPSSELKNFHSQVKKNKFICILLPIAIRMNEEVFKQRMEILRLQAKQKKGIALTKEDSLWLTDIKTAYGISPQSSFEEILKRVDIIPLPLLLAQAALESGWGTSRATRELKNLFGMHASNGQPCKKGFDTHNACLRLFSSIGQSVSAYIRLLNVGKHYAQFRDKRSQMRASKEALDSIKLLQALGDYNETPVQYIQKVRELMTKSNKLTQFVFKEDGN